MKTEQQSISEGNMPPDNGDSKNQSIQARALTSKQLQMPKFIAQQDVAEFETVVQAIEDRRYKQVDAWKSEASIRASEPPVLDTRVAEAIARQKTRLGWH